MEMIRATYQEPKKGYVVDGVCKMLDRGLDGGGRGGEKQRREISVGNNIGPILYGSQIYCS